MDGWVGGWMVDEWVAGCMCAQLDGCIPFQGTPDFKN